jgi:hypothetical protein
LDRRRKDRNERFLDRHRELRARWTSDRNQPGGISSMIGTTTRAMRLTAAAIGKTYRTACGITKLFNPAPLLPLRLHCRRGGLVLACEAQRTNPSGKEATKDGRTNEPTA